MFIGMDNVITIIYSLSFGISLSDHTNRLSKLDNASHLIIRPRDHESISLSYEVKI